LTGWDKVNDKAMTTSRVSPTHIGIGFWPSPPPSGYPLADGITIQLFELPLYEDQPDDDGHPVPRWLEHPVMGSTMDVAAISPPNLNSFTAQPMTSSCCPAVHRRIAFVDQIGLHATRQEIGPKCRQQFPLNTEIAVTAGDGRPRPFIGADVVEVGVNQRRHRKLRGRSGVEHRAPPFAPAQHRAGVSDE
jgi:hypothetical protein